MLLLNHDKRLVGVVSLGDLAVHTGDDRVSSKTLQTVSQPGDSPRFDERPLTLTRAKRDTERRSWLRPWKNIMKEQRTSRRRETSLILFLTAALAVAATLLALMVTGRYFFAMLAVAAGMIVMGLLPYLLWGWPMERSKQPAQHETMHYP